MEQILSEILNELKYQTKILEGVFETKRANGSSANLEAAMNIVMKMPFIQQMGLDPQKFKEAVLGHKKES